MFAIYNFYWMRAHFMRFYGWICVCLRIILVVTWWLDCILFSNESGKIWGDLSYRNLWTESCVIVNWNVLTWFRRWSYVIAGNRTMQFRKMVAWWPWISSLLLCSIRISIAVSLSCVSCYFCECEPIYAHNAYEIN